MHSGNKGNQKGQVQLKVIKNEGASDTDIESFLIVTSDKLQANRFLSVEQGSLKLGNAGIAREQLESVQEKSEAQGA